MSAPRKGLNILYVGTLPPHPGGSAILAAHLIVGLDTLGHVVRAVAPITSQALHNGDAFALNQPAIAVRRFLVPYFESSPNIPAPDDYRRLEGERSQEMLSLLIARERPDIIIIGRETFAWHVPDLARTHSIPSILLVQGGTTFGLLKGSFTQAQARQLLEQFRKVDLIVAVAKHLAESLRPFGFNNIKVIPNPVDLDQFSPRPRDDGLLRKLAIPDDSIIVVHISNLKMLKRPQDLVSSAERAMQQNPKLLYVIVGDGPCREVMEEACRQKHISESFRFVGWVDYHRVPDYINLADMVVMPSEAEGQALVYLETQACARLILASDIPAAREVIVDGETGLLFRKGDIDDLTTKTLAAAADSTLRAEIGRKARERVKVHCLNDAVAAYVATLEHVVRRHGG